MDDRFCPDGTSWGTSAMAATLRKFACGCLVEVDGTRGRLAVDADGL
jgi:hypothetical protein